MGSRCISASERQTDVWLIKIIVAYVVVDSKL